MTRRVVITGLGTVNPLSSDVEAYWKALCAGHSGIGQIEPGSVQIRVSGLGVVPANFDPKTGTVSYQVTQKLRDKSCTVIVSAKSQGKKVEAHWTFGIEESPARAVPPAAQTPQK